LIEPCPPAKGIDSSDRHGEDNPAENGPDGRLGIYATIRTTIKKEQKGRAQDRVSWWKIVG
jgi:hypothetical protein